MLSIYSRAIPAAWAALFGSLLAFNALHFRLFTQDWTTAVLRFPLPAALMGLCLYALGGPLSRRLVAANALLAVTVSLYVGEFMMARRLAAYQRQAAQRSGNRYDPRTKRAVIRDLRRQKVDAYPVVRGENMLVPDDQGVLQPVLTVDGAPLLPLASIPHSVVVSCNETGQWQVYQADRHGFNNPDTEWDRGTPVIALIGDSFAHGSCVGRDQDMAAHLRHRYHSVINLGVGGFGPLLELASLAEYAAPLHPSYVLWCFFEGNDLTENLPQEIRAPLLRRYMDDPDFSQRLIERSAEIESVMRSYLDRQMEATMARVDKPSIAWLRNLSLDRLRSAVGLGPLQIGYNEGSLSQELALFERILDEAKRRVSGWGGRLYLVYLPESDRYLSRFGAGAERDTIQHRVHALARRLRIPVIDVAAAFSDASSPAELYAYPGAHYSPRGYRLTAETIITALERDRHHLGRDTTTPHPVGEQTP